jgi:hypothetical protein
MQLVVYNTAALTITAIYYAWRSFDQLRLRRDRLLRERVAYMLWTMATHGAANSREIPRVTV